jgi:hypothetical protein
LKARIGKAVNKEIRVCSFIIPRRLGRTTYKWMTLPPGNSLCCETFREFERSALHEESLSHDKAVTPFGTRFAGMRIKV